MNKRLLISANTGRAILSSRAEYIDMFLAAGWEVVIATVDSDETQQLISRGVQFEPVAFHRGGLSAWHDLLAVQRLWSVYRKWRPAIIHQFHLKPILFGSLAAKFLPGLQARRINTVTGLGFAYAEQSRSSHLLGRAFQVTNHDTVTIFQNPDDERLFIDNGWIHSEKSRLIISSGVDLEAFHRVDRRAHDAQHPVVVMLSRLLRQKGIHEFIHVAQAVRERIPAARFILAGGADPEHPDAIDPQWLSEQSDIEYPGRINDVHALLSEADLFLFPSYYREGVPRALLEAAASGLPVVAFDVPGVREAVETGQTGYLVKKHDKQAMIEHVLQLLSDQDTRLTMGDAGAQLMRQSFDKQRIDNQYMQLYQEMGFSPTAS